MTRHHKVGDLTRHQLVKIVSDIRELLYGDGEEGNLSEAHDLDENYVVEELLRIYSRYGLRP